MDFRILQDVILEPDRTLKEIFKKKTLGESVKTYSVVLAAFSFLGVLISAIFPVPMMAGLTAPLSKIAVLVSLVVIPLYVGIVILVSSLMIGVIYLFARLFGGKGDYGKLLTLNFYIMAAIAPISFVANMIPIISGLLSAALMLYSLYLLARSIEISQKISKLRAVLALFVPIIVFVVIAIAMSVAMVLWATSMPHVM